MKHSRLRTLLLGLIGGVAYAFTVLLCVTAMDFNVSVTYIFVVPVILGVIPVLFTKKEELRSYTTVILLPWLITFTFFLLVWGMQLDGLICLTMILAPFMLLGTLGAFIAMAIKRHVKDEGTPLYASLLLPVLIFIMEYNFPVQDKFGQVNTSIDIDAPAHVVWERIKNVEDIQPGEITTHFVHVIGVPKPVDGRLDREGVGGNRRITWERGIRFVEHITSWNEGEGFGYDIDVDPASIPPQTLDDHVIVGGKYFDVIAGNYRLERISATMTRVHLRCSYRVTTSLNTYSSWCAQFVLNDFNEMILEVVKGRSEQTPR